MYAWHAYMRADLCADRCTDRCIDRCIDMCTSTGMCTGICTGMRTGMCTNMYGHMLQGQGMEGQERLSHVLQDTYAAKGQTRIANTQCMQPFSGRYRPELGEADGGS